MTVRLWRIAAVTPDYPADDMTGTGAKITGGRWNSTGVPMVYTSEHISLAVLETLAHLGTGGLPLNRYLVRFEVPDAVWNARRQLKPPVGWDAYPAGIVSKKVGDQWQKSSSGALMAVPSVIVPDENNILINPTHPHASLIKALMVKKWHYDMRFF